MAYNRNIEDGLMASNVKDVMAGEMKK